MEIIYTLHNRTWNQLCWTKIVSHLSYFGVLSYSVKGKKTKLIVYVSKPNSFAHSTVQVFLRKSTKKLLTSKEPKYSLANSQKPVPILSSSPLLALLLSSSWIQIWVILVAILTLVKQQACVNELCIRFRIESNHIYAIHRRFTELRRICPWTPWHIGFTEVKKCHGAKSFITMVDNSLALYYIQPIRPSTQLQNLCF